MVNPSLTRQPAINIMRQYQPRLLSLFQMVGKGSKDYGLPEPPVHGLTNSPTPALPNTPSPAHGLEVVPPLNRMTGTCENI